MYILSSANFKKDPPWNIFCLSVHAPATCVQHQKREGAIKIRGKGSVAETTWQTQKRKPRQNRKSLGIRHWKLYIFHSHHFSCKPTFSSLIPVIVIGSVNYAYNNRYNLVLIKNANGLVRLYTWELSPSYLVCWPDRAICRYIQN